MSNVNKKAEEARAFLQSQPPNTRSWANMANEEDAAKKYLPGASNWADKQATIEEEASAERAQTPNSISESNLEDLRKTMYAYDNYTDRMGLPRRASRTPSRERRRRSDERRRTARRRRSPSPRRRSRSPTRRYGVGRRYVAAPGFGTRHGRSHRSPSPRRRSPSPRRRSPSPRYSRRRSPSPRYSRRRSPSPRRRNVSPLRYTVAADGRIVNEFGRNVPNRRQTQRRPYKPANWNV